MRFRPRFSVRTLAIFVTLVCAYFAAWEATKKHGTSIRKSDLGLGGFIKPPFVTLEKIDANPNEWVVREVMSSDSPAPFIIRNDELVITSPNSIKNLRRYDVWLFGLKFKLPFESEWKEF